MNEKRTGLFENGLIWFGAGVSIAEILTGTYLAPLGMGKGLAAILIGHIIGCLMLFLAGVIGGSLCSLRLFPLPRHDGRTVRMGSHQIRTAVPETAGIQIREPVLFLHGREPAAG